MGRKPRPVTTARELGELKDLWRKVLPRIEEALNRGLAGNSEPAKQQEGTARTDRPPH